MEKPVRNEGIDALRLMAAFSIISLHPGQGMELPPPLAEILAISARYAVPVFFMISGYFLRNRFYTNPASIFTTLFALAKIAVGANLIYLPFVLLRDGIRPLGSTLSSFYLLSTGTSFHLWFLSSLFFGILVLALLFHGGFVRCLWLLSAPIGIVWILMNHFPSVTPEQATFLRYLSSIPLIHCGIVLARWRDSAPRRRRRVAIALILAGGAGQFLEAWASSHYLGNDPVQLQLLFSTIPFSAGLFLLFQGLAFPHLATIGRMGREYSLGIYIIHVWLISIFRNVYQALGIFGKTWSTLLLTPLVFAASLVLLAIYKKAARPWLDARMNPVPHDI